MSATGAGEAPRRLSELNQRLLTAVVAIPILIVLIVVGGPVFAMAVAGLLAAGAWECCRAAGLVARHPQLLLTTVGALALPLAGIAGAETDVAALTVLIMLMLAVQVVRAETKEGFREFSIGVTALIYAGLLGSHLIWLRLLDDGRSWFLLMLFTTFASDTGAFFTGRTIGGRKLAPRVSPGKTVSGALGGLAAGALAALGLTVVLGLNQPLALMAMLGGVVSVAAQAGDLAESLLKRSLGVKDMGHLFPGHGGVLDRLDSVLFAAPVVYYGALWLTR